VIAAALGISLAAQNAGKLAFEAATVRPSVQRTPMAQRVLPTRIDFVNTPLRTVVFIAFRITDVTEASIPDWTIEARFDIQATYPAGATAALLPEMLQTLLKDRFGLVAHTEPRRIQGYELVVGKDGVKMREVEAVDELEKDFSNAPGPRLTNDSTTESPSGKSRSILIPEEIGYRRITARSFWELRTTAEGVQRIDATRMSMPEFAGLLRLNVGKPVFDKTGLTGVYQFKTELDRMTSSLSNTDRNGNLREPTGVSTFRAIENLGLTLQELRTPVNVLVVDNVNRTPTEN